MDAPTQQNAMVTTQLAWPYFSHSAMMLKLIKYDEMYKDDSLWEISDKHGKIFSEKGRQILESIWNGLFCKGTKFPENMYWKIKHLNQFTDTVKEICKIAGMSQCFKGKDEIRERRKLLYDYFLVHQKNDYNELYRHTFFFNRNSLTIKGIILTTLLLNLTGRESLATPPLEIDLYVYMKEESLKNLSYEIEKLIKKDV